MSGTLTKAEGWLLTDAFHGVGKGGGCPAVKLTMDLADVLEAGELDRKWKIDRDGLMRKIRKATPVAAEELFGAIERFWEGVPGATMPERVQASGLLSVALYQETEPQAPAERPTLAEEEALAVAEAFHGVTRYSGAPSELLVTLADGIWMHELDQKWGVDGEALLHKLRKVTALVAERLFDAMGYGRFGQPGRAISEKVPSKELLSVVLHEETNLQKAMRVPEPFNLYNRFDLLLARGELTLEDVTQYLGCWDRKLRDYALARIDRVEFTHSKDR